MGGACPKKPVLSPNYTVTSTAMNWRRIPARMKMKILQFSLLAVVATARAFAEPSFDYNRDSPIDVRQTGIREEDGVALRDITYAALDGARNGATIIARKELTGTCPGILFVHWY